MAGARLSESVGSASDVDDNDGNPLAEYLETITLLQEEVARLEGELKRRDDRQCELAFSAGATDDLDAEPGDDPIPAGGPDAESERLAAELADRDETIRLLLDELERLEAAQAATRTEWEHLAGWVAELEGRVDGQDSGALRQLEERLVSQQQEEDTLRQRWERDRRDWETQRQILQARI